MFGLNRPIGLHPVLPTTADRPASLGVRDIVTARRRSTKRISVDLRGMELGKGCAAGHVDQGGADCETSPATCRRKPVILQRVGNGEGISRGQHARSSDGG